MIVRLLTLVSKPSRSGQAQFLTCFASWRWAEQNKAQQNKAQQAEEQEVKYFYLKALL